MTLEAKILVIRFKIILYAFSFIPKERHPDDQYDARHPFDLISFKRKSFCHLLLKYFAIQSYDELL